MDSVVTSSLYTGLTLSDFHLFGPLKGSLQGHFYVDYEALWNAVDQWVQRKERNFYEVEICGRRILT
jgi:hypothetical protein